MRRRYWTVSYTHLEGDAADCAGYGVLVYVFVTIQNKTHPVDEPLRTQKLPGSVQGALLNIESDDLTVSTDERGEKCRVAVSYTQLDVYKRQL